MRSSTAADSEAEAPDLVCELDSIRGIVDALSSVRWKRHQVCLLFLLIYSSLSLSLSLAFLMNVEIYLRLGCSHRIIRTRHSDYCRGNRLSSGQGLLTARGTQSFLWVLLFSAIQANCMLNFGFFFFCFGSCLSNMIMGRTAGHDLG